MITDAEPLYMKAARDSVRNQTPSLPWVVEGLVRELDEYKKADRFPAPDGEAWHRPVTPDYYAGYSHGYAVGTAEPKQ